MDLSWEPEHEAFRAEVLAFLDKHWSGNADERHFRTLATERGYLYRNVPRRYGGSEQAPDVIRAEIIRAAFAARRAPREVAGNGISMLIPTLLECGSDWQKDHFIPNTVTGEYVWAQGYSEPQAGSDLVSLRTKAELVNNRWIINGHKLWSSHASESRYMYALVRTEPDAQKHAALSYLLIDLRQPGVTIRPLTQMTGEKRFSEVFFDNAETGPECLVGARGEGWSVSRRTLKHERSSIGGASTAQALFESLLRLARRTTRHGRPAMEDASIRQRMVQLEGYVSALAWSSYRALSMNAAGQDPGRFGVMVKLVGTNIGHLVAGIARDLVGDDFLLDPGGGGQARWTNQFMGSLGVAIAGGTSNIQRNIIAERGLGLPRDQG